MQYEIYPIHIIWDKSYIVKARQDKMAAEAGKEKIMIIGSVQEFEAVCKRQLATWYRDNTNNKIWPDDVFVVWSCKTLKNYKAMLAANVYGDGIYAEYTFNGDTGELYEDVYKKITNRCITEETKDG